MKKSILPLLAASAALALGVAGTASAADGGAVIADDGSVGVPDVAPEDGMVTIDDGAFIGDDREVEAVGEGEVIDPAVEDGAGEAPVDLGGEELLPEFEEVAIGGRDADGEISPTERGGIEDPDMILYTMGGGAEFDDGAADQAAETAADRAAERIEIAVATPASPVPSDQN